MEGNVFCEEVVGKGFKKIGYSLCCPNCSSDNTTATGLIDTVAGVADWLCFDCGCQYNHEDSPEFWQQKGGE